MKKITAILGLSLLATASFAQSTLERIAGDILADRFGIRRDDVFGIRRDRGDIFDLGPTLSMSRYGNASANDVQRLRASGMGWGEIAHKIGMHPGTFNKLRKQGYFDRDPFWDDVVKRRYGTRQEDIDIVRRRGGRLEDILGAVVIGKATNRKPADVYDQYRRDKDWDRTADKFKFDFSNHSKVGKKVGWDGASVPPGTPPRSTGPGKSKGKGPGNTSTGKRNPPGKGKGNSNAGGSQGKGKGKGGGEDF